MSGSGSVNLKVLAANALVEACPDFGTLDLFLEEHLDLDLKKEIALPNGASFREIALTTARHVFARPDLFDRLANALYAHHVLLAPVVELYRHRFPDRAPVVAPGTFPWQAHFPCCIDHDTVVIGRERLKAAVERAEKNLASNVVVVRGGPRTGKTYSWRVIDFLARNHKYRIVSIDLSEELGPSAGADVFARALLMQMSHGALALPERGGDPPERWAGTLANWITGQLQPSTTGTPVRWWIVIDRCDAALSDEVRVLLQRLVLKIGKQLRQHVRLCLLGYPDPLPDDLAIVVENLRAVEDSLAAFFEAAFECHGESVDSAIPRAAAEHVLEVFRSGPRNDPALLHDLARDAVRLLFPIGGAAGT